MTDDGKRNWPLGYAVHDGEMRCELLAVTVALTPVKEGEGGFSSHRVAQEPGSRRPEERQAVRDGAGARVFAGFERGGCCVV